MKRRAWAVSLYDGTGIWGEANHMGIYGTRAEARNAAYLIMAEYGTDSHCKIKTFPVEITLPAKPKRRKKA